MSNKQIEFESKMCDLVLCAGELIRGYKAAAIWSTTHTEGDKDPIEIDLMNPVPEWSCEAEMRAIYTCTQFMNNNLDDLLLYVDNLEYNTSDGSTPWDCAGHDLWLTSNGYGAGYWDRGLGVLGKRLTYKSNKVGESNLIVGDDGKLYFE